MGGSDLSLAMLTYQKFFFFYSVQKEKQTFACRPDSVLLGNIKIDILAELYVTEVGEEALESSDEDILSEEDDFSVS